MTPRKPTGPAHGTRAKREDASPSHDVDEMSAQSFPSSDPPATWSSAGRDDPEPVAPDDPAPRSHASRRRLVHRVSLLWFGLILVAVSMVAIAVFGLSTDEGERPVGTVIFTAIGILGAAIAVISTIWRGKAGDSLDESRLH